MDLNPSLTRYVTALAMLHVATKDKNQQKDRSWSLTISTSPLGEKDRPHLT
ncbi:unnamed protein product [Acidithrix sp. C25]|nr:unnamed protein product [Acidithrix sp. C25]